MPQRRTSRRPPMGRRLWAGLLGRGRRRYKNSRPCARNRSGWLFIAPIAHSRRAEPRNRSAFVDAAPTVKSATRSSRVAAFLDGLAHYSATNVAYPGFRFMPGFRAGKLLPICCAGATLLVFATGMYMSFFMAPARLPAGRDHPHHVYPRAVGLDGAVPLIP